MVLLLSVTTLVIFIGAGAYLMSREKSLVRALAKDESTGGIWFHPGHTWVSFQPEGVAKIGIDKFLRQVLGRVDEVILPSEGRSVKQGQVFLTLVHGGRQVHLVSPLDGVVRATNARYAEGPEISYKDDFLVVLRPTRLKENMTRMKGHREADGWFRSEVERFKDFITLRMGTLQEVGATLADGGVHTDGIVEKMDEETLKAFAGSFLR
ncbi:MAG: Glycine cleavage H-protein [Deltaproteobacteria bacterium]|nr:Glycine cleavage H-protein [Deltaproteobacteria bacterium]